MAVILAAVGLTVAAVAVLALPRDTSPLASRRPTAAAIASAGPSPSVVPPASPAPSAPSSADPAIPRPSGVRAIRIVVPRLGIDLPIVEGDGMSAPIGEAAHFPGTGWPDSGSNTYIYGHAQEGMFLPLWDVVLGDEVILTLLNDEERCYAVDEIIPKASWNATSFLMPTDHERLTLQTSTSYTPTSPRFVVIALPCG